MWASASARVEDHDADDPPCVVAAAYVWSFTVHTVAGGCDEPFTAIPARQGTGKVSPFAGQQATVQGNASGVFNRPG